MQWVESTTCDAVPDLRTGVAPIRFRLQPLVPAGRMPEGEGRTPAFVLLAYLGDCVRLAYHLGNSQLPRSTGK